METAQKLGEPCGTGPGPGKGTMKDEPQAEGPRRRCGVCNCFLRSGNKTSLCAVCEKKYLGRTGDA
jgi:hypothetical protein